MKIIQMSSEQREDFFHVISTAHEKLSDEEFNEFMSYFLEAIIRRGANKLQ